MIHESKESSPAAPPMVSEGVSEAAAVSGFVCVCVQKSVEFNIVDHKLHRATKDQELHEELEKLSACTPSQYAYQLGGGCRIMGATDGSAPHPLHIASWGESVAVFEGTLTNFEDLAKAFPASHTTTTAVAVGPLTAAAEPAIPPPGDAAPGSAPSADSVPNPAHLLCLMYELIGVQLLELLRGTFSFCLYHGKTGRVLAARDGSGAVPLYQGMSAAQSLVISSREDFTASCAEVKEFAPGYFKYGWYAEPRKFGPSHTSRHSHSQQKSARNSLDQQRGRGSARCSLDQPRPHAQPLQQQPQGASGGSSRRSLDMHSSRRDSPDVEGGRAVRKESKGKAQAQSPGAVEGEGWTVVGARSHTAATGAGSSPAPQGRRRSMDTRSPHGAVQAKPEAKVAAAQPSTGSGRRSLDVHSSSSGRSAAAAAAAAAAGFKWDINAPAYTPHACETR